MQWWDVSPALRSGVCLHSLFLARPGQVEAGCFDVEECLLSVCYHVKIATARLWSRGASFPTTLCSWHWCASRLWGLRSPSHGNSGSELQVRSCGTRHATSVQNVLRIWEHSGDVFAPYVSLGGPLSVLLARSRWATLALDRAVLAGGSHPEWFGHWPPPGAQLGLRVAIDDHPRASMLNPFNFVRRFLVERAQAGVEDAAEAAGHLRCLVTDSRVVTC